MNLWHTQRWSCCLLCKLHHSWQVRLWTATIEQKGVAQLMRFVLTLSEGMVSVNHHKHRKQCFSSFLHSSICCMQTYFYFEEVSKHCKFYLQRRAMRKMTGKYLYTTIAHKQKRVKKSRIFIKILTCYITWCHQIHYCLYYYEFTIFKWLLGTPQAFATSDLKSLKCAERK